ncbi:hypothetical protein G6F23_015252 [Rhizopus arrhizus]|nr:hypothetical protein G6F23_015252 [Rhizopus arrhizus]
MQVARQLTSHDALDAHARGGRYRGVVRGGGGVAVGGSRAGAVAAIDRLGDRRVGGVPGGAWCPGGRRRGRAQGAGGAARDGAGGIGDGGNGRRRGEGGWASWWE